MSIVKNEPKHKNGLLEHRAFRLDLPRYITKGDDFCSLRYHKK